MSATLKRVISRGGVLTLLIFVTGCNQQRNEFVPPPPPKVTVAKPLQQSVVIFREFVGRSQPRQQVDVRARVQGFLEDVKFKEGDVVEAGTPLYQIETEQFQAALDAALANQAVAEAELTRARNDYERLKALDEEEFAASKEMYNAEADFERAKATLLAAKATVTNAQVNLDYTKITAPISGRVNRTLVDAGNLVGQGDPTLLTSIVPWDLIDVYFTLDEREIIEFRRNAIEAGRIEAEESREVPAFLQLSDGTDYAHEGKVDYIDNRVDPTTGTIRVRAVFPNPERLLVPGVFGRVRVPNEPIDAILVPESSLQRDLSGYYVMVLDDANEVDRASVQVGETLDTYRVIQSGLTGDQRVIVKGLQRVRPGLKVDAESVELPRIEQQGVESSATLPSDASAGE